MTNSKLRDILDLTGFSVRRHDDGRYVVVFGADEDFRKDIIVVFIPEENGLKTLALAGDYTIPSDKISNALLLCNKWMHEKKFARPYVKMDESIFVVEENLLYEDTLPDSYVANWVKLAALASCCFYAEAGKEI